MTELTFNNVPYTWELAGSNGASFMLFPTDNHTSKDIAEAKKWLKQNRDVVYISIANESDLDARYRAQIYQHPYTKPLQWFEINADDEKLIRKCRKEGMSIETYVNEYVIGKEYETTEANINKFPNRGILHIQRD